ncbi:unnamed protein product (macronuclear) [Paramecium tetraurelia]|uniref:EF-hand domain-containing protein n=1 Tax=Paramecium tetraurelia TaxID=5888 RepID=A0C6Y6_PARTE|nr:uncharacterized protein GSPATT00035682001 [Paramecium tetraurelia]CAK66553.1 unnamed protein product [Paramecium tetraurelia]|eukprot:XP_001433950.1 hypothetical protein (macronuclear) [Paramecium tetraurelia strain d4-2]
MAQNLESVYKDISSVLTREIKEKGLWCDFVAKADQQKQITFTNFEEVVKNIIIDINIEEIVALKEKLFIQEITTLSALARQLKINIIDQNKKKTQIILNQSSDNMEGSQGQSEMPIQNNQNSNIFQSQQHQQGSSQHINMSSSSSQRSINVHHTLNAQTALKQGANDKRSFQRQDLQQLSQQENYIEEYKKQIAENKQEDNMSEHQNNEDQQPAQTQQLKPVRFQKEVNENNEPTLDQQIEDLFNSIDSNQNGWLDPKELNIALLQLGINPTPQELDQYFQVFDKNHDEKISKMEFNVIIKDQLMKAILSTDELFAQIQSEYNILTDANRNELDMAQLQQVFKKLGILLDNNDLIDLFEEIDEDGSGFIEQDELINFLDKPFSQHTPKSQTLLTKINNFKNLSITGIRELFQGIPKNFTYSFIFAQNKKGLNTISSCLSPQLDSSGLLYEDLNLIQAQKYNLQRSLIDMTQTPPLVFYEIKFHLAAGLPSPDEKKCDLKSFRLREVAMCLFDKVNQKFIGNTVFVPCQADPSSPDKWLFLVDYPIILRCVPTKKDQQLVLVIEFIAHMEKLGTLNPLSVSYGEILLTSIKKPGKQIIQMNGGSPFNQMVIDPQSIIQPKGLFKKQLNQPQVTIEFMEIELKKPPIIQLFSVLPQSYLLPKTWLQLMHDFREYFAYRSVCQGFFDSGLPDYKMKSLLDMLDMPECGDQIANWWNQNIKTSNFKELINLVDVLCQRAYLTTQRVDFYLKAFPPVQRINHKYSILEKRRNCLQEMFRDLATVLGKRTGGRKNDNYFNMEPLILCTLQEEDKSMMEKILSRRKIK